MKLFGMKFRPFVVILCLVIGIALGCFVLCSCAKISIKDVKEGFVEMGASPSYNMGAGVKGSYDTRHLQSIAPNLEANHGPALPLPPGEMFSLPILNLNRNAVFLPSPPQVPQMVALVSQKNR